MQGKRIAFIGRAPVFSPQNVDNDAAILEAVRSQLLSAGFDCMPVCPEDELDFLQQADIYLTMGRLQRTLLLLLQQEHAGRQVVNSTDAVQLCNQRASLMMRLERAGIAVPPLSGSDGYWVKRGDGCRETADDVRYAADRTTADRFCEAMRQRGIREIDVRAHVIGEWVKFYGVRQTKFFRCYGQGTAVSSVQVSQRVLRLADAVAQLVDIDIYGGDCIVRSDGQPVLVDFNDWPSFSRCRDEAAEAIASNVIRKLK
jgi:hypothetical protein